MSYEKFNRNLIANPLNKQEVDFLNLKILEISDAVAREEATEYQERELDFIVKVLQTSLNGMRRNKAGLKVVA